MKTCPKCRSSVTPGASDCAACGTLLVATGPALGRAQPSRTLRGVCALYVTILVAATVVDVVIAWTTPYGDRTVPGCSFSDALLPGLSCRGFPAAGVIEIFLGLPLLMFYVTVLAPSSPAMLVIAALLWSPVLYLIYGVWRRTSAA